MFGNHDSTNTAKWYLSERENLITILSKEKTHQFHNSFPEYSVHVHFNAVRNIEINRAILTLRFPSAVSRSLLHVPQKLSDIEVMNPTWP